MRISDWSSDVCSSDLMVLQRQVIWMWSEICVNMAFIAHLTGPTMLRNEAAWRLCKIYARTESIAHSTVRIGLLRMGIDRKSVVEGKSVSVSVDLGGRGIFKKKQ